MQNAKTSTLKTISKILLSISPVIFCHLIELIIHRIALNMGGNLFTCCEMSPDSINKSAQWFFITAEIITLALASIGSIFALKYALKSTSSSKKSRPFWIALLTYTILQLIPCFGWLSIWLFNFPSSDNINQFLSNYISITNNNSQIFQENFSTAFGSRLFVIFPIFGISILIGLLSWLFLTIRKPKSKN